MSPEQIGTITALVGLMEKMSGWPFGMVLLMMIIGPWVLALFLDHSQAKRFDAVKGMYDNNVTLVENYQNISKDFKDLLIMNTQASQQVTDAIEKNQFCPMVRLEKRAGGVQP